MNKEGNEMKKSKKPPVKTNMIVPEVKTVVQPKAEPAEDMVLQLSLIHI